MFWGMQPPTIYLLTYLTPMVVVDAAHSAIPMPIGLLFHDRCTVCTVISRTASPPAPTVNYSKGGGGGRREPSYCDTDSSLSSDMDGGGGGRGSSRSSLGSSLSGSPAGSLHDKDPMQYSDDEDEGRDGYKVGGYHTVKVRQAQR